MRTALVCGAGGFIGGHLIKKLKRENYWVRGVDVKKHEFADTQADQFLLLDLREPHNCYRALTLSGNVGRVSIPDKTHTFDDTPSNKTTFDEVYQLAADMGGMGFIHSAECDIMHNSALINIHMIDAAVRMGVPRYFFSSSACVYRDMQPGEPALSEEEAFPAMPDNEYGWEKLYAERMAMAYSRNYPIHVRIARFQNCYGPEGTWRGGREKAPAAICRKVAMAPDGGTIPVWGDGTAVRGFTYVDDLVDGIYTLMQSNPEDWEDGEALEGLNVGKLEGSDVETFKPSEAGPPSNRPTLQHAVVANIGTEEYVTVNELVETVIEVSGKEIDVEHVEGPVGVQARNFSHTRMHQLGWEAETSLREGIAKTYAWIEEQVQETMDE
jgi:nucleoside-diphosphate-sugar epimerase